VSKLHIYKTAAAPLALSIVLVAQPVAAQDTQENASTEEASSTDSGPLIVVTGSRIRRPELVSTIPVTNFGGEEVYKQSEHNLGEALNKLPSLRSTYSQSNPELGIGVAGLNLLDLRGLGARRTLVLVDGRRHVPSDLQVTASAVDINTIPIDLVERVDIVTGGNSAVYGSDAIAGVVNFILKKDYEGFSVRGGMGIPGYGKGENYFLSGIAGKNFADGRGNIAASLEYTRQGRLFASDVPWRHESKGFVTRDTDPSGSDGIPDAVFTRDLRNSTIARTGLVAFPQNIANPACGGTSLTGAPFNCDYIFTAGGSLIPITFVDRSGTSPFSGYIGGNSETGNEGRQISVYPYAERYVANVMGRYEFSDAAEVFFEGKYARSRSIGSNSGPAFNQGQFITFNDPRSQLRLDNPFLSSQARTVITEQLLASGNNNGLLPVFGPLSAGDITAINDGSYRFAIAKSFEDLGIRDESALRETYRIVAGVRGDISPNWNYEVSANYGRTNEAIDILGNVNVQRLMLALDAGINPATGQVACRAQFDPTAAFVSPDVDEDGGAATLANDIAACVPYNPFGLPDNRAAQSYIVSNAGDAGHLSQFDVTAFVSGDTSGFFELPGGPIAVALGAEYRRENAYFKADDVINQGLTFLNSLQTFDPDPFEVKEAFGELNIPILANQPFFEELALSGAARVSDYKGETGTVWAYNVGGRWAPVRDIAFRANYGRAIRAPNYTETDSPLGQNFAPGFQDPCATARLGSGGANRQANCQADLGSNLTNADFQNKVSGNYSLEILSGGNPLLTAETSNSLTIGTVIQPHWVPGLAVTVDYYDIKVKNVIASPTAQQIVNQCYDLPDLNNQFCALFSRFDGPGLGPDGEVPGEILVQSLIQGPVNFAKRQRRGIDVDVSYRHQVNDNTFINSRIYYTHTLKASNFEDPNNPDFENRILSELGDPKNELIFDVDVTVNDITIGYGAHYIGSMYVGNWENYHSLNGEGPLNEDAYDINKYPSVLYHDLRLTWQFGGVEGNRPYEVYVGANNILDKHPPLNASGLTSNSAIYDVWGRRFFIGFGANF
jgi:outer membrane receptor protein involved in Fe transport